MIGAAATAGIRRVRFADGADRDVYLDANGQYVISYDSEPVYSVWILTDDAEADAAVIVPAGA